MAKYTRVNQEACIACGACGAIAPEVYDFNDDGLAYCLLDSNKGKTSIPNETEDDALEAFEGCPTEAIEIQDEPFN